MTKSFQELTEKFLQKFYSFNPVRATQDGYKGFDNKFSDLSTEGISNDINSSEELIETAKTITPQNQNEKIDLDLLIRILTMDIFEYKSLCQHKLNPALYNSQISSGLFSLIMGPHRSKSEIAQALVGRIKAIPNFLAQAEQNLEKPVTLWTDIAIKEIPGTVSYIQTVVIPFLKEQQVIGFENLIEKARHSLFEFQKFLESIKKTQDDFSIGEDNFNFMLKEFHGFNIDAQAIRQIGLDQIDLLTKQINEQVENIDVTKSWTQIISELKENHPTEEDLLKSYQQKTEEIKVFLKKNDIVTLPSTDSLIIMETPEFLQNSIPYAAYCPPTMFAEMNQGVFFVSPTKGRNEVLKEHCYSSFPLTVLHEAYPGHHLQFATQKGLESPIRKIYNVASYYEGWTLYCEEMMFREGFYDNGMRLYQLKDRLWRAARIVVDVSMHCYGMTDSEAVNFLVDYAKLSQEGARVDVNWYTQSPTTPLSYLVGTLQVDEIREAYQAQGHTLKEFHDAFLACGAIPLSTVRDILIN